MGGNVFKNTEEKHQRSLVRLSNVLYEAIKRTETERFDKIGFVVAFPKTFETKTSHGDVDMLIHVRDEFVGEFSELWFGKNLEFAKHNKQFVSLLKPLGTKFCYQVDVTLVRSSKELVHRMNYMSFGKLNMLIGRIASANNLSYKDNGLYLKAKVFGTGKFCEDLFVEGNFYKVLDLLGFDQRLYDQIKTEENMLTFLKHSSLFDSEYFNLAKIEQEEPRRFKEITKDEELVRIFSELGGSGIKPKAAFNMDYLLEKFCKEISLMKSLDKEHEKAKARLNGNLIKEWTGCLDKDIGLIFKELERKYSRPCDKYRLQSFIKDRLDCGIKQVVLDTYVNI